MNILGLLKGAGIDVIGFGTWMGRFVDLAGEFDFKGLFFLIIDSIKDWFG